MTDIWWSSADFPLDDKYGKSFGPLLNSAFLLQIDPLPHFTFWVNWILVHTMTAYDKKKKCTPMDRASWIRSRRLSSTWGQGNNTFLTPVTLCCRWVVITKINVGKNLRYVGHDVKPTLVLLSANEKWRHKNSYRIVCCK